MGYYVTLKGRIDQNTAVVDEEKLKELKKKYFWIDFDEGSFEFNGNWGNDIINFLHDLSKIMKQGNIIIDCDGEIQRDVQQYKIDPQRIWQRNIKRIVFEKWKPAKL